MTSLSNHENKHEITIIKASEVYCTSAKLQTLIKGNSK